MGVWTKESKSGELVQNGSFIGNANGWTLGTGWTYASNSVSKPITASSPVISQNINAVPGSIYLLTFTLSGYSGSGNVTPSIGGSAVAGVSANGTYVQQITAGSSPGFIGLVSFQASFTCAVTINFVSVKIKNIWTKEGMNIGTFTKETKNVGSFTKEIKN